MKNEYSKAASTVLGVKKYKRAFMILTVVFFSLYILLPVVLTPGNSLAFQLSLFRPLDFLLFLALSLVTALLVVMQVYVHKQSKKKRILASVGQGGVSIYSALFAGLLAAAACTSCIAGLLGFLGAGSVLFIAENQWPFVLGALAIVLVSLHFVAKRVNNHCGSCEVHINKT